MTKTVCEERIVYLPIRHREVRCRLWYEVSVLREGLFRYFLIGIQELEEEPELTAEHRKSHPPHAMAA